MRYAKYPDNHEEKIARKAKKPINGKKRIDGGIKRLVKPNAGFNFQHKKTAIGTFVTTVTSPLNTTRKWADFGEALMARCFIASNCSMSIHTVPHESSRLNTKNNFGYNPMKLKTLFIATSTPFIATSKAFPE